MPVLSSANLPGPLVSDKHRSDRDLPSSPLKRKGSGWFVFDKSGGWSFIYMSVCDSFLYQEVFYSISDHMDIYGTVWIIPMYT